MKPSDYVKKGWRQLFFATIGIVPGIPVVSSDPRATHWCIIGAIRAAYPEGNIATHIFAKLKRKLKVSYLDDITLWNDRPYRKQEEVVELLESIGE